MSLPFDPNDDLAAFRLTLILDPFDLLKAAMIGGYPVNCDDPLRDLHRYATDPICRVDLQDAASFGLLRLLSDHEPPLPYFDDLRF